MGEKGILPALHLHQKPVFGKGTHHLAKHAVTGHEGEPCCVPFSFLKTEQ